MKAVVVGGGVLGASAAFHLRRRGAEVVLVDEEAEGRATSAGAGIVCPWSSRVEDPDHYRIACEAAAAYPELVAQLAECGEANPSYARIGALIAVADAAELDGHEARIRARAAVAPAAGAVTRLAPAEARALFPPLRADLGAVHIAGGARVDGRRLAAAMARAAERLGARRVRARAALDIAAGRVRGVTADGEAIGADAVLLCTGAWAPEILAPYGITLAVRPQRGQIIHLRIPHIAARHWPVMMPLTGFYMLTFDDDRIVIGATREEGTGFDHRITAGGLHQVLAESLAVAPGLASASLVEVRIGFRPMGPGWTPLLGPVPGIAGLFLGNGLGPNGLTIGPQAGRMLALAALGEAPPAVIAPYAAALSAALRSR